LEGKLLIRTETFRQARVFFLQGSQSQHQCKINAVQPLSIFTSASRLSQLPWNEALYAQTLLPSSRKKYFSLFVKPWSPFATRTTDLNCCAFKVRIYTYQGNTAQNQLLCRADKGGAGQTFHTHLRKRQSTPSAHIRDFPPTSIKMKELQKLVSKPKYSSKPGFLRFHILFYLLFDREGLSPYSPMRVTAANHYQTVHEWSSPS